MTRKWKIAWETILIAVGLLALKLLIERLGLEFVTFNPLFTSIIAGGIFLFGLILAGTLADYKECEKIPAEIVAACESIYEEGCYVRNTKPDFNLDGLVARLGEVISGFRADIGSGGSRAALAATSRLSESFLEMERLGVPPNYIVRLKSEESLIRKNILRMYYIQKTNFLPSAFVLVQSLIAMIVTLLLLTKIEPFYDSIIILVFITYLFIYILKLLKTLDTPFLINDDSADDVSLFLMREFKERIGGKA